MKVGNLLVFTLMLFWTGEAEAAALSGKLWLNNQNILVTAAEKYHGQFDLGSSLPVDDEFVLTKVTVSFRFQDDTEWMSIAGPNSLENTGKITRSAQFPERVNLHYNAKSIVYMTNEEEVAELIVGNNKYYATTIHRREVSKEILGQKSMNLGLYRDDGDNRRKKQHYRITESVVEAHRDGYDGLFAIRQKTMDLATLQDLAQTGLLEFELGGKGDYIFIDALLQYEGFVTGPEVTEDAEQGLFTGSLWLALISLPIGGLLWRKKNRFVLARGTQKRITQRKIPKERAF